VHGACHGNKRRDLSIGAVCATLERLEAKGMADVKRPAELALDVLVRLQ
jgi:hypothetical protein